MEADTEEKRGIIRGINGSGGMLMITFEDPVTHKLSMVPAENPSTVRALEDMFGGVITAGTVFDVSAVIGKEVGYAEDYLGILAYLTE